MLRRHCYTGISHVKAPQSGNCRSDWFSLKRYEAAEKSQNAKNEMDTNMNLDQATRAVA